MGVLYSQDDALEEAEERVAEIFGSPGQRTGTVPFQQYTGYYDREMGHDVKRFFLSLGGSFQRGALAEAKLATNRIERDMALSGRRVVNLDPGLLTPESLILATTKPYYHRIYLAKGIYAELTLIFRKGSYEPLRWTYPDYREEWTRRFFNDVRKGILV
ncbi:MAG: DUF4416 family protein [bacterium]|nr:MAG: DUF4416 family protein [bacterium]